jgi:uncharacterized radical SAM superfamily protein
MSRTTRCSIETLGAEALNEAQLERAWQARWAHFPPLIGFDYPVDTAVISLTGTACALECAHCGRRYLQHMIPIQQAVQRIGQASSLLISGGCDTQGRVPVQVEHLQILNLLRPGRRLNWHVGLISQDQLEPILPYVDVVSFDFVGDEETIGEVYGLQCTVADYVATYQLLRRHVPVIPHLTIGLRGGELGHERKALDLLTELGCDALVFLVLIPTQGTRYADRRPPAVTEVVHLLAEARLRLPRTPLYLGCMRPHGVYRRDVDPLAVRAGVNRIVSPAREAVTLAQELGLAAERGTECCVLGRTPNSG